MDSNIQCEAHFCSNNPINCVIQIQNITLINQYTIPKLKGKISRSKIEFPGLETDLGEHNSEYKIIDYQGGVSIIYK